MTNEQKKELPLKPGEMPIPQFFDFQDKNGVTQKWVGIEAFAPDGDIKTFLFYQNVLWNLAYPSQREYIAKGLAEMKLKIDADFACGPAIDLDECDSDTNLITTLSEGTGVYIEKSRRAGFASDLIGARDKFVGEQMPETIEQILAVLPKPLS